MIVALYSLVLSIDSDRFLPQLIAVNSYANYRQSRHLSILEGVTATLHPGFLPRPTSPDQSFESRLNLQTESIRL